MKRRIIEKLPHEFRTGEKCLYRFSNKDHWFTTTFYYTAFEEKAYTINCNKRPKYLIPFEGNECFYGFFGEYSNGEEGLFPSDYKIPEEYKEICYNERKNYLQRVNKTLQEL